MNIIQQLFSSVKMCIMILQDSQYAEQLASLIEFSVYTMLQNHLLSKGEFRSKEFERKKINGSRYLH